MIEKGNIINEEPQNHWGFLSVKGKVVIDFGCGRACPEMLSTTEYFILQGVAKVIGIDMWPKECEYLIELINNEKALIICDRVNSPDKIRHYLQEYNPDIVKCDIEGDEKYLEELTSDDFINVQELAVEFHNEEMRQTLIDSYQGWGFNNIDLYSIGPWDPNRQGVIHLTK